MFLLLFVFYAVWLLLETLLTLAIEASFETLEAQLLPVASEETTSLLWWDTTPGEGLLLADGITEEVPKAEPLISRPQGQLQGEESSMAT